MKKIIFILFFAFKAFSQNFEEMEVLGSIEKMKWALDWNKDLVEKGLKSGNEKIRSSIIYYLSEIQKKEAEPYLLELINSSIPWERFEGLKGLLCLGFEDKDKIKELLDDQEDYVRSAASAIINENFEPILFLLNHKNINYNIFGIEILACKKEEGAKHLIEYLKDSRDEIRAKAAEGLRFQKDLTFQKEILEALKKETYFYVQNSMARTLVYNFNYPIIEEAIFTPRISKIFYNTLKYFNKEKEFFTNLWKNVNNISKDKIDNLNEIISLIQSKEQIDRAIDVLNDEKTSNKVKAEILEFLASNSIKEGLLSFKKYLKDKDPIIKGNSIWGLGSLKNRDHIKEIEGELKNPNSYVRWCALWALEEILGKDSLRYAEELINDESKEVQQTAKDILLKYKEK